MKQTNQLACSTEAGDKVNEQVMNSSLYRLVFLAPELSLPQQQRTGQQQQHLGGGGRQDRGDQGRGRGGERREDPTPR